MLYYSGGGARLPGTHARPVSWRHLKEYPTLQAKSTKTRPNIGDEGRKTMPDGCHADREHQLVRNYHEQSPLHSGAVNPLSRPQVETGDQKNKEINDRGSQQSSVAAREKRSPVNGRTH